VNSVCLAELIRGFDFRNGEAKLFGNAPKGISFFHHINGLFSCPFPLYFIHGVKDFDHPGFQFISWHQLLFWVEIIPTTECPNVHSRLIRNAP
jgi:hypothetical protein